MTVIELINFKTGNFLHFTRLPFQVQIYVRVYSSQLVSTPITLLHSGSRRKTASSHATTGSTLHHKLVIFISQILDIYLGPMYTFSHVALLNETISLELKPGVSLC